MQKSATPTGAVTPGIRYFDDLDANRPANAAAYWIADDPERHPRHDQHHHGLPLPVGHEARTASARPAPRAAAPTRQHAGDPVAGRQRHRRGHQRLRHPGQHRRPADDVQPLVHHREPVRRRLARLGGDAP